MKNNGKILDVVDNLNEDQEAWLFHPHCFDNLSRGHSMYFLTNEDGFTSFESHLDECDKGVYRCDRCGELIS